MTSITVVIIFVAILAATYYAINYLDLFNKVMGNAPKKHTKVASSAANVLDEDLQDIDFSDSSDDSDSDDDEVEPEEFTLERLRQFNGEDEDKVYVSVKGEVFDVTGSGFYSKSSDYHIFAGHDASINLARSSLDPTTLDNFDLSILSAAEHQDLQSNLEFYEGKYVKVGWLKDFIDANQKSSSEKKND